MSYETECPLCRNPAVAYDGGRLCAEHLRVWLDRGPPLIAVDERGAEYRVGPKPWREFSDGAPCARCEGRRAVVAEAVGYGWRMVPCPECQSQSNPQSQE